MPLVHDDSNGEYFLDVPVVKDDDFDDISTMNNSIIYDGWAHSKKRNVSSSSSTRRIMEDSHHDTSYNNNIVVTSEEEDDNSTCYTNTTTTNKSHNNNSSSRLLDHVVDEDSIYTPTTAPTTTTTSQFDYDKNHSLEDTSKTDDALTSNNDNNNYENSLEQEMATIKFELADARAQVDWYKLKYRNLNAEFQNLQLLCNELKVQNAELLQNMDTTITSNNDPTSNNNNNSSSSVFGLNNYYNTFWGGGTKKTNNNNNRSSFKKEKKSSFHDSFTTLDCSWDNDTFTTFPNTITDETISTTIIREEEDVDNEVIASHQKRPQYNNNIDTKKKFPPPPPPPPPNSNDSKNMMMNEIIIQTPQMRTTTRKQPQQRKTTTQHNNNNKMTDNNKMKNEFLALTKAKITELATTPEEAEAAIKDLDVDELLLTNNDKLDEKNNNNNNNILSKAFRRFANSSFTTNTAVKIRTSSGNIMRISERTNNKKQPQNLFDVELSSSSSSDDNDDYNDNDGFSSNYLKFDNDDASISSLSMLPFPNPKTSITFDLSTDCCSIVSENNNHTRYKKNKISNNEKGGGIRNQWRKGLKLQ